MSSITSGRTTHLPAAGPSHGRAVTDHGLRFDESLPVFEDWDLLMQAVLWCGVADSGETTAVWRHWRTGESSSLVHSGKKEWESARESVIEKFDSKPLLLPKDSLSAIQADKIRIEIYRNEAHRLQRELDAVRDHLGNVEAARVSAQLRVELMQNSMSWRLSMPVRAVGALARRVSHAGSNKTTPKT